jgi:hypothetical protein
MLECVGGEMKRMGGLAVGIAAVLTARPPDRLTAQTPDSTVATARDTLHRIGPTGALWRSLLVPGWGQAATGRHVTGALFVVWEGTTAMMALKAQQEANYLSANGSGSLHGKRQEVQDWIVLWVFNHLFSGAEAFVSGHLRDFPKDLRVQAVPGRLGISLPLPHP